MRHYVLTFLLCLAICACSTQSVVLRQGSTDPKLDTMQHFFVSGLGQTQTVNAAEVCGGSQKVAKVERLQSGLNSVLSFLTRGIYTPYTAKVYCSE